MYPRNRAGTAYCKEAPEPDGSLNHAPSSKYHVEK